MGRMLIIGILLIYIIKEHVCGAADCHYYCQTLHERNIALCSENERDCMKCCQECFEGNVIHMDNKDFCVQLKITQEFVQEMPLARINSTIVLFCDFNVKVQCKWELNGQEVDTGRTSRIRLAHSSEPYTRECSLIISRVSLADMGQWTCSNTPINIEHNTNHTLSTNAWLQVYQPEEHTTVTQHFENLSPDGQRLDNQTPSFSLKTSPFLIAGIAVALTIVIVLISIVIYKKVCAKKQSNYRFEEPSAQCLISANRNQEPVKLNFSITINTPYGKEIVAL